MFTSRAEYRLSLRADNADQRLTLMGMDIGCVGAARAEAFRTKVEALARGRELLRAQEVSASEAANHGIRISSDGRKRTCEDLLSFADVEFAELAELRPALAPVDEETRRQLKRDALYSQYVSRQKRDVESLRRDEAHKIPQDFDFDGLTGLPNELKQKLSAARPETLGQAGRVEGVTPAALTLILARLRQLERQRA
jgi:tRNA uridine 5-carboxymethylaminomethyl modification enzyme